MSQCTEGHSPSSSLAAALASSIALFPLAACGASPPLLPIDPPSGNSGACSFEDVVVVPADGSGPLHRMTPVAATWQGSADVAFDVRAGGESVHGELLTADGRAVFMPLGPLPANAVIQWSVSGCGQTKRGTFATGALLHPLEDLAQCLGEPFEMDLRRAALSAPSSGTPVGDMVLKWRVAPALLLMIDSFDDEQIVFWLVPADVDGNGAVTRDLARPAQMVSASIADNPYVALQPRDFAVALGEGSITMRSVELIVGLGGDSFEDGRIVAEVDTRDMPAEADPCGVIDAVAHEKCHPCDRSDGVGSCFLLEMTDVVALPSATSLAGLGGHPVVPLPCPGPECP